MLARPRTEAGMARMSAVDKIQPRCLRCRRTGDLLLVVPVPVKEVLGPAVPFPLAGRVAGAVALMC